MKHPITPEMIRRFVAIIAKTRSGKTFAIKGAIEELLDAGEQVVVLDPTSAYYGLRLDRDGKTPAHPNLLIVGGDYGDIPIVPTAEAAAALADVIFDQQVSCVIDLGSLVGELVEWSTAFATRFYQRSNKGQPVTLVIDEAHEFAPKDAKPGNGKKVSAGDMLVAFRRLATGGGSRGIRLVALTQRPAKLHNDLLSSCDTIIAMRTVWPSDRKVIAGVIDGADDKEKVKEVLGSLASLKPGEGWIWDTDRASVERVKFPPIKTFDSSATPTGKGASKVKIEKLDRERIGKLLADAAEKIKADDPETLKERIAKLDKELVAARNEKSGNAAQVSMNEKSLIRKQAQWEATAFMVTELVELRKLVAEQVYQAGRQMAAIDGLIGKRVDAVTALHTSSAPTTADVNAARSAPRPTVREAFQAVAKAAGREAHNGYAKKSPRPSASSPAAEGAPNGSQHKILDALAWWRDVADELKPSREAVAFLAGMKPTGGHFNNTLGSCRTAGWVDYPAGGLVSLTTAGNDLAGLPDFKTAVDAVRAVVDGSQRKIVDALYDLTDAAPGSAITRAGLAEAAGMDGSGGHFNNTVGSLRSAGIIDYPSKGLVALCGWVMGGAA